MTKEEILEELNYIHDNMASREAIYGLGQIAALIEKIKGDTQPHQSGAAVVNPPVAEDIENEAERKSANYAPFPNRNQDPSFLNALREAYRDGFMACAHLMRTKVG